MLNVRIYVPDKSAMHPAQSEPSTNQVRVKVNA
jgi:hypothetical protein